MPRLNRVRIFNLKVKNAKFRDLNLNMKAKNTYILAGNGTGKSSIIGFILNTLSPSVYDFPKGDSIKSRYLKHYVPQDRPGGILIEWLKDTPHDQPSKLLLTGQIVQKKNDQLYQYFFIKEYLIDTWSLDQFPFSNEEKYNTSREIRRILRQQDFKIVDKHSDWIKVLETHYIENRLIKRLVDMNRTENSLKEGITFDTKRGFIEYIIQDIMPIPTHAEDLISGLKKEFTDYREIPRFQNIIEFLKSVKKVMYENESLYDEWQFLTRDLKDLLDTWNLLVLSITRYQQILGDYLSDIILQKKNEEEELNQNIERLNEIERDFYITSLQYFRLLYSYKDEALNKIRDEKTVKQNLQAFFGLYEHLNELRKIQTRIEDLELRKGEKLGPLQKELHQRKILYEEVLSQTYQYALSQVQVRSDLVKQYNNEKEEIIGKRGELEAEIRIHSKKRNKQKTKVDKAKSQIQTLLNRFQGINTFPELEIRVEKELKQIQDAITLTNDSILKIEGEMKDLELKIEIDENSRRISERNLDKLKGKLISVKKKWNALVKNEGFILKYGSIRCEQPAYHLINVEQQNKLNIEISTLDQQITKINSECNLLNLKIQYYKTNKIFPPSKEIEQIIQIINSKGIVAIRGWEYYKENVSLINKEWVHEFPYIFEGIITQGANLNQISEIVNEIDIATEYPIFITLGKVFKEVPNPSKIAMRSICLKNSIQWKYDKEQKEAYYNTLKDQLTEKTYILNKKSSKLSKFKELRSNIQSFLQHADQEKYQEYQEGVKEETTKIETYTAQIDHTRSSYQIKKNNFDDLDKQQIINFKNREKWEQEQKQVNSLKISFENLSGWIEEIQKLGKLIAENNDEIRKINDDILPQIRKNEEEARNKLVRIQKRKDLLLNEYKQVFSSQPTELIANKLPNQRLEDVRQSYNEFEILISQNQVIKELDSKIKQEKKNYKDKDYIISSRCKNGKITRSQVNLLWEEYKSRPNEITQLEQQNLQEIDSIIKKERDLENDRTEASKKIKEFESYVTEDVEITKLSLKKLQSLKNDLENDLEYYREQNEELIDQLKKTEENEANCSRLKDFLIQFEKDLTADAKIFTSHYSDLKGEYVPSIQLPEFNEFSIEEVKIRIKNLENQGRSISENKTEINSRIDNFKGKKTEFSTKLKSLIKTGEENDFLKEYQLLKQLQTLQIKQIRILKEECENEIVEREKELNKSKEKLTFHVNLILEELEICFQRIYQFQNTKITVKDHLSFTGHKPIKIKFAFDQQELSDLLKNFLMTVFTSFDSQQEFPREWCSYDSFIRSMINTFLEGKIREIEFLLPRGKTFDYSTFEEFLLMSGGQTATMAIVLFCYIAHFKIKYRRQMDYQNRELVEKIPLTIPFINDNPTGQVNKEELVRLQLDVAKSLQIQLIYFSGIEEAHNVEEFDTVIKVLRSSDLSVFIPSGDEKTIINGPVLHHTPIRENQDEETVF